MRRVVPSRESLRWIWSVVAFIVGIEKQEEKEGEPR